MSIISTLIKNDYVATEAQIEALARDVVHGEQADSTYLRAVLVATQGKLSDKKRRTRGGQIAAINEVNNRFYPHVLKGVGNGDLTPKERTRRATFARTAVSTLRGYVRAGGDVRTIDVGKATKAQLGAFGRPVPKGTRVERAYQKAQSTIVRAARKIAQSNAQGAREWVEGTIETLQNLLKRIDGHRMNTKKRIASDRPRMH